MPADPQTSESANRAAAARLIDSCLRLGVDYFFLAPGSRCTPLTMAVANRPDARLLQHFDERGLAFACLGYGRARQRPGAFICTSGTAVANALPAVVEASMDHVPMLLLTADRPPELRATGANQTIDQLKIFGGAVRWFLDLPCPSHELNDRFWHSALQHAVQRSADGPVHLNCMFREPFGARDETASLPDAPAAPAATVVQHSCQWHVPRGRALVMAGGCCRDEALAAERLARRLGCPFLADVSTGLRGLSYDLQLMRDDTPAADVILHVGGRVVSKRWLQYVDAHPPQHYLRLTPHADRLDPLHRVTQVLRGPIEPLCDGARISELSCPDFLQAWSAGSERCRRAAEAILDHRTTVNEPAIARAIAADLPRGSGLLLGNSMPIREMDMFGWWETSREVQVAANRGASGIDGLIATSAGLAAGLQRPTTALIGDLAALHDLNSLALLATSPVPVVLVVVNNDGGGIFHFLPVASQTQSFERFFATPHGRNFQCAARMFDLAYEHPASLAEFTAAYRRAINRVESSVIEVRTDRAANRVLHREIEQAVRGATA